MPAPKRLSQAALAKTLGVSRATVSLVLRGGRGASPSTYKRVLAAAHKLGYRPNALVRSIRSGKSHTVGVFAHPQDSYWRDVCYGIHDRLLEADHMPFFLWNNDRLGSENETYSLAQIHRLLDHWVDGVILWPFFVEVYSHHLREFANRNIPIVAIDHIQPALAADVVESDQVQIASLIADHLLALGHREILVVSGPKKYAWADERCRAIQDQIARTAGTSTWDVRLSVDPRDDVDSVALLERMLASRPETTAIVACTDGMARHVYAALRRLGWAVPRRVSVIGVADLDFAALMNPPLTTVRQDGYAVGQRAAQMQLERSAGLLSGQPRVHREPGRLVVRQSTSAPSRAP